MLVRTLVALSFSVLVLTMPLNQDQVKRAQIFGVVDAADVVVAGHHFPAGANADP
ncbi:hypothetical protein BGW80DRAFT_1464421 [Lactifluus volemus]|nr:hypothetical protein BGW80DRAFT_1464421 [Lactifluus volemus]